ncbi:hypothetical protein EVAR_74631_1 [Eumeta japonica]|uniref:DNA/RNA-binding domain-containing protein n=1 Tax=Eumeta variegata TaxID=151549 RepID=A0A4C1W9P9_EUMVA|nr:hypothetical protein EVAR_74631_1 [Eumeta japonica]
MIGVCRGNVDAAHSNCDIFHQYEIFPMARSVKKSFEYGYGILSRTRPVLLIDCGVSAEVRPCQGRSSAVAAAEGGRSEPTRITLCETSKVLLTDGLSEVSGGAGARSAWLECALAVSLLMFGALLERCCALLPEAEDTQQHSDALLLLPAIKVWTDWMLCHRSIWNPPPLLNKYELGNTESDPWDSLAKFMNILEALDDKSIVLEYEPKEGA